MRQEDAPWHHTKATCVLQLIPSLSFLPFSYNC
jgi:hypothetical protein